MRDVVREVFRKMHERAAEVAKILIRGQERRRQSKYEEANESMMKRIMRKSRDDP